MKSLAALRIFVCWIGWGLAPLVAGAQPPPPDPFNEYRPPFDAAAAGLRPLFDGHSLAGWVGDPECWSVRDGTIIGVKGNQALRTVDTYNRFRLVVSTRQVKEPANHQGIGFWGEVPAAGNYGYASCVLVMPPMNWTWDYTVKGKAPGQLTLSIDLAKTQGLSRSEWSQAEILVDRKSGTIRMAVNGIEMLRYVDDHPERLKQGPILLQAHSGNLDVRYKDVFIEVDPAEDRLMTVK